MNDDPAAELYADLACQAVQLASSHQELDGWWRDEALGRPLFGIAPGTPAYDRIVAACRAKREELNRAAPDRQRR